MKTPVQKQLAKSANKTHRASKNLGWVLVSIEGMIEETLYFCEAFAHSLHAHHNPKAADIFSHAAQSFQQEFDLLETRKQGLVLPQMAPWDKPHADYDHPVNWLMHADYLMTEDQAWKMVGKLVQIHTCYYDHLKSTHTMEETHHLVNELQLICQSCQQRAKAAQNTEKPASTSNEDLDPPMGQS